MERNLKLKNGKEVGFHMANLGSPVWGHDLGWTIKTENLEECLEIITTAFRVKDQIKKEIQTLEKILTTLPKDSRAYDMNKYRLLGYQNLLSEQPTIESVQQ